MTNAMTNDMTNTMTKGMDYPLALLHNNFSVRLSDGSTLSTGYSFWRNQHNKGSIKTYRNGSLRMVPATELNRLKREGFKYRGMEARLVKKV